MMTQEQQALCEARAGGKSYEEALADLQGLTLDEYKAKQAHDEAERKLYKRIAKLHYEINSNVLFIPKQQEQLERLRSHIAQLQNQGDETVDFYREDEKALVAEIDALNRDIARLRLMLDALPSPAAVATLSDDELNQALAVVDAQLAVEQKNNAIDGAKTNSELKAMEDYNMSDTMNQAISNLPTEFLSQRRFFRAKVKDGGKKVPCLKAWSKPENQSMWHDVKGLVGFDVSGHGVADDYLFLDFDHVLDDHGNFINETAAQCYREVYSKLGGFCERSISGSGLHIFGKPTKGKFAAISNGKKGVLYFDKDNDVKLELFYKTRGRYCLMTGNCFDCEPQAPIAQGAIVDEVLQDLLNKIAEQNHAEDKNQKTATKKPARTRSDNHSAADLPHDYDLFRAELMLNAIDLSELDDTDWFAVISSCKHIGVPYHVVDAFNRRDSKRYDELENQRRWDSATDPTYNIETLHGIAKRFRYDEKASRREWFKFHPELSTPMNDDNIVRTRDRIPDCPVNLVLPQNFLWTLKGITQKVSSKKKDRDFDYFPVTATPIIITKKFYEPTKHRVEFEIAIRTGNKWIRTEFDGKTLGEARLLTELCNYDAIINDVSRLKQFFDALRACNPELPQVLSYNQTGWTDDTFQTFAYPGDDCIVRRSGFDFDKALATRGNAELWKQKFKEVVQQGGATASLCIGTALAACLARPLNIPNPQTHLQGTSGGGKTALQKFTASIFGNPRELILTFAATNKRRQLNAAAFNDLPSFFDELETRSGKVAEEALSTDVYNFADGKGNQANKRDGTARETFKFGGSRLTTGERPILKQHDLRGAYKRIIQLDIHGKLFVDDFGSDLHIFSESNFGHFGKQWIHFAQEHMPEIQKQYHHFAKSDPTTKQYEPTHLKSLAACLVAFEFFKQMLGITPEFDATDLVRVRRYLLEEQLPTLEELDDTARATEALRDFTASHEKFFMRETVNKPEFDNEFTQTAQVCYGKRFRNGEVAFYRTELTKILEVELGFASAEKLISAWYEKDCLVHVEGKKTFVMYINGRNQRLIRFKAGVISEPEDVDIDEALAD